jgi:N utilization substance protein A
MSSPIEQAIKQIVEEKGLQYEAVIDAIESALAAAYRKDFGDKNQNTEVKFDPTDGSMQVWDVKTVVEDVDLEELERLESERKEHAEALALRVEEARKNRQALPAVSFEEELGLRYNPKTDIMISEAKILKHDAQLGDMIRNELPQPEEFGRMAAMTAKQVITQKLREAEREVVYNEFKEHEGELLNGTVQRREGRVVLVDLGRTTAIMRPEDQIQFERYNSGDRIKVFVRQVGLTTKGPEILVSRTADELVRKLFEVEIPEVLEGLVDIKAIAREAGSRSKVAVSTSEDSIDPIGACIGQRGTRIQTVISELGGEKVDIIEWSENPVEYITHSISPAKVTSVRLDESDHTAYVKVNADQLSLAIGKGGQNVRLAAKLTGWKINIGETENSEAVTVESTSFVILSEPQASEESPNKDK